MKKLYLSSIALLTTLIFVVEGKHYPYLSELGNKTSNNCQQVRAAIFKRGNMELYCDSLENRLKTSAEEDEYEGPGGWISQFMGASDLIEIRLLLREVLKDESDDEIKWKEYNEYLQLKHQLKDKHNAAQKEILRKKAEEKTKNRF